jgi:hypothetical protein
VKQPGLIAEMEEGDTSVAEKGMLGQVSVPRVIDELQLSRARTSCLVLVDHMGIGQPDAPSPSGRFGPYCGQWKLTFVLVLRDDQAPMNADFKASSIPSGARQERRQHHEVSGPR